MRTTRFDAFMRVIWLLIALLLLFLLSVALARKGAEVRSAPRLTKDPTPFEWLIAGYKEIPAAPAASSGCAGTPTGRIEIRLENVLDNLRSGRSVYRNMTFVPMTTPPNTSGPGRFGTVNPEVTKGFPTNLDFRTVFEYPGGSKIPLVGPGAHVVVRVILETRTMTKANEPNDNKLVSFLNQGDDGRSNAPPDASTDSRFAVLQGYGVDKPMFFCRQPIKIDSDNNPYVDFAVQSVGNQPYWGSFGIGLLVRDQNGKSVVPIILDPQVENEG